MKIKGLKRGQTIELFEPIEFIADGTEVTIKIIANNSGSSKYVVIKQNY
jgi:hypothetical protein